MGFGTRPVWSDREDARKSPKTGGENELPWAHASQSEREPEFELDDWYSYNRCLYAQVRT